MVREVEVTVRSSRTSKLADKTVYVTKTTPRKPTLTVVDVEVPEVVKRAANTFLIPLRPNKPQPKPKCYNLEFYVNNTRFTAKLSYNAKQENSIKKQDQEKTMKKKKIPEVGLPVMDTENQSLLSNLGTESLPPCTPRDETAEFDLESVFSELELESLPSRAPSPCEPASTGEGRKVPLIKLSSAPADSTPPSGRLYKIF